MKQIAIESSKLKISTGKSSTHAIFGLGRSEAISEDLLLETSANSKRTETQVLSQTTSKCPCSSLLECRSSEPSNHQRAKKTQPRISEDLVSESQGEQQEVQSKLALEIAPRSNFALFAGAQMREMWLLRHTSTAIRSHQWRGHQTDQGSRSCAVLLLGAEARLSSNVPSSLRQLQHNQTLRICGGIAA